MSTGDGRAQRGRRNEAGFTLPEIAVLLVVASLLGLVIERSLTTTHQSATYLEAVRRATERGQKVSYEVYASVTASHRLFQRDDVGVGYFEALDLSRLAPTTSCRLPLIDELGELGPDEMNDAFTGSALLFVQEADSLACVADAGGGRTRYVDSYRFVCIYPSASDEPLVAGEPPALDLVVWRSVAYPSQPQILAIEDEDERRSVVKDLLDRYGHEVAWDPDAPADSAFFPLDAMGGLAAIAESDLEIAVDEDATGWGRLVTGAVGLSRTDASVHTRRSVFSAEHPSVWAPDGFEVKVTGASGSRKVWMHLVVESAAGRGRLAVHPSTMIASVRDL